MMQNYNTIAVCQIIGEVRLLKLLDGRQFLMIKVKTDTN